MAELQRQRDDNHLAYARLNLAAAWLALDRPAAARVRLQAVWPAAQRVRRQAWWADHAALLAALEGRHQDAALLAGAADARHAAAGEPRQANEARGHERTQALLHRAALPLQPLHARGAVLPDAVPPPLAFGST